MLAYMRELIESVEKDFLTNKDWSLINCEGCGSQFYAKRYRDTCGAYACENGYAFLAIPSPRTFMTLEDESVYIREFLNAKGYSRVNSMKVKQKDNERTLFASVAGHIFDSAIYESLEPDKSRVFCLQPVIRLQSFRHIGKMGGISTSFVNIGTEQWNTSIENHFTALDDWLDLISGLGLYVGNLTLKKKSYENDWRGIKVPSESLKINYRGLELGIANFFFDIPQKDGNPVTMSDISFGLERLAWAVNKTGSYFDTIGPLRYSIIGDESYLDTVRTLTLMGGSGVKPGTNNHGSKFRMFAKRGFRPLEMLPLNELIAFYYSQWEKFVDLPISLDIAGTIIIGEVQRQENIGLNQMLGTDANIELLSKLSLNEVAKKDSRVIDKLRNVYGRRH